MHLSLVQLIVVTLVVGALLWALNNYVAIISPPIKQLLNAVAIIILVILWAVFILGLVGLGV